MPVRVRLLIENAIWAAAAVVKQWSLAVRTAPAQHAKQQRSASIDPVTQSEHASYLTTWPAICTPPRRILTVSQTLKPTSPDQHGRHSPSVKFIVFLRWSTVHGHQHEHVSPVPPLYTVRLGNRKVAQPYTSQHTEPAPSLEPVTSSTDAVKLRLSSSTHAHVHTHRDRPPSINSP